jgi:hypothetical protein
MHFLVFVDFKVQACEYKCGIKDKIAKKMILF